MDLKNPVKAIRQYCINCSGGFQNEVKICPIKNCELYPFRMGKNPYRTKRELTAEQREAAISRLRSARSNTTGEKTDKGKQGV